MSDLGRLFGLCAAGPKPLENFTTTALAIAINHDQRPIFHALRRFDRTGHESSSFPVLDLFREPAVPLSISAEVQQTLWPSDDLRLGYLDLVLSVRDSRGVDAYIWVEVKVDAWESGDQISVYLAHAERRSPRPDVVTLGRTKVTELVPFVTWSDLVEAVESVSNPHYTWVSLREFLLEKKIVRPKVRSVPDDAKACIDVIVDVNRRIRHLWPAAGTGLAWVDGALRKAMEKVTRQELLATGGPIIYGLEKADGLWQWCLRFSVAKNSERVPLDGGTVIHAAETGGLSREWRRHPGRSEVLERTLPPGALTSHDDIVQWFDDGLRQLYDAGVLNSYLSGLEAKRAAAAAREAARKKSSGDSAGEPGAAEQPEGPED